jgi:hypothetical protein
MPLVSQDDGESIPLPRVLGKGCRVDAEVGVERVEWTKEKETRDTFEERWK